MLTAISNVYYCMKSVDNNWLRQRRDFFGVEHFWLTLAIGMVSRRWRFIFFQTNQKKPSISANSFRRAFAEWTGKNMVLKDNFIVSRDVQSITLWAVLTMKLSYSNIYCLFKWLIFTFFGHMQRLLWGRLHLVKACICIVYWLAKRLLGTDW